MAPLALYKPAPYESHALRVLPDNARRVTIPYVTTAGVRVPADTRVIWPLACKPR